MYDNGTNPISQGQFLRIWSKFKNLVAAIHQKQNLESIITVHCKKSDYTPSKSKRC